MQGWVTLRNKLQIFLERQTSEALTSASSSELSCVQPSKTGEALTSASSSEPPCVQPSTKTVGETDQPVRLRGWMATGENAYANVYEDIVVDMDDKNEEVGSSSTAGFRVAGDGQRAMKPGMRVQLHGLTQNSRMNGKKGMLLSFDPERGRWQVRCSGRQSTLGCKPSNLRIVPAQE